MADNDLRERATALKAPTLLLFGRRDPAISAHRDGRIAAALIVWFLPRRMLQGRTLDWLDAVGLAAYASFGAAKGLDIKAEWIEQCAKDLLAHKGESLVVAGAHQSADRDAQQPQQAAKLDGVAKVGEIWTLTLGGETYTVVGELARRRGGQHQNAPGPSHLAERLSFGLGGEGPGGRERRQGGGTARGGRSQPSVTIAPRPSRPR